MNSLVIELTNGYQATGKFYSNPVADHLKKALKHLQHVTVPTNQRDYLYYVSDRNHLVTSFVSAGIEVDVTIDPQKLDQQNYLNELHVHYEHGYPASHDPKWLHYHELLHSIEARNSIDETDIPKSVIVDFRHYAGPLVQPFERDDLKLSVTKLEPGVCYAGWQELGKTPMQYWFDGEPEDQTRICELSKPWLTLKPSMYIVFEHVDLLPPDHKIKDFLKWFAPYQKKWMEKYNINELSIFDYLSKNVTLQGGKIPLAVINKYQELEQQLANGNYITRVRLQ